MIVDAESETIWATQKAMAELFEVGVPAISKHLSHIFEEGELEKNMVVSKMEITSRHGAIEGKTQANNVDFYNLDAIIAVGYRVSSIKATRFRIWATKVLKEFMDMRFSLARALCQENRQKKSCQRYIKSIDQFRMPDINQTLTNWLKRQ